MTKFRKGDVVSVELTVDNSSPSENYLYLTRHKGGARISIPVEECTFVRRRALQVGDIVCTRAGTRKKLLAIHDEYAWCQDMRESCRGVCSTYYINDLIYAG